MMGEREIPTARRPCRLCLVGSLLLQLSVSLVQAQGVLQSLQSLETLRSSVTSNVKRVFHLDVIDDASTNSELAICHLVDLNRHSALLPDGTRIAFPTKFPLEALSAVLLALEHLNTGNGRVVPQLNGLPDRCHVRFTAEFADTAGLESQGVDRVIDILDRDPADNLPCAFIGAFRSPVSVATSILTGVKGYPQMSSLSTATQLSDKSTFPLFGRVVPTANWYAVPLMRFLYNQLEIRHLVVLHTDNANGLSYVEGIRNTIADSYPDFVLRTVAYNDDIQPSQWLAPISAVRATGFRYIFAVASSGHQPGMIEEAYKQGISGDGLHTWIFSNAIGAVADLGSPMPRDSPLHQSGIGALTFSTVGMLPGVGRVEAFKEAWKELGNEADLAYLQSKVPTYPDNQRYNPRFTSAVFDSMFPFTPLFYDVAIAMGLGACGQANTSNPNTYLNGSDHYANILNTSFDGVSGSVEFDPTSGDRTASSALYVIENLVPRTEVDESDRETGNFTLVPVQIAYFDKGQWTWNEEAESLFNDGTSRIPPDLPPSSLDYNYISTGLRAGGLAMAGLIVVLSISLSIWTQINSNQRAIRASQPIFLHFICLGTLLMGASIIPLSFDDKVASTRGCDIACMSFPWFFVVGWCTAVSALFTKTHRVNRIFHRPNFRRAKVTAADVMKPMAASVAASVLILTVWTVLDPLKWTRDVEDTDIFGRWSESRGYCTSDKALAYVIPLAVLCFSVLLFAIYEAYIARKISTEFAESEFIARAMSIMLVVGFLGIPIAILSDDDANASFFVRAAVIFVVCASVLFFIFVPKIRYHGTKDKQSERAVVAASLQRRSKTSDERQKLSDSQGSASSEVGVRIVEHPKLKGGLQREVDSLTKQNETMRKRISDLEAVFEDCEDDGSLREKYKKLVNAQH